MNQVTRIENNIVLALALGLFCTFTAIFGTNAQAGERVNGLAPLKGNPADATDRLIVKFRDPTQIGLPLKISNLGNAAGTPLTHLRAMSGGMQVVRLAQNMSRSDVTALAKRLTTDPSVASVEPDFRMYAQRVPNDPMYSQQWHYYEPAGGINLPAAWDVSTGSSSIVVAVIDTGVLPHADLAGRLVQGYDFIGDTTESNDGDGRDPDASDPGDYGCSGSTSSWHGTHVAGTIGANSNNGLGVAGVNWNSKILPVRVLGKCGGYTSDIVDGMRWASGMSVAGVPANAYPARVINLSLGSSGSCSATFQSAVSDVIARGTVVVVAAGNGNADAVNFQPANCNGVIAVAATTRTGGRASFSNYGSKVAIAAPGGSTGILSTINSGTTVPVADSYAYYQGTSMATPHVVGVVSLMLSVDPTLTPAQVLQKLQQSARAFPTGTGTDCTTALCGAGIVDAAAALAAVTPPPTTTTNYALPANGGSATASSTYSTGYAATAVIDGDRRGNNWGAGGGWNDATANAYPDWVQVNFNGTKSISEIDVFTVQDNYSSPADPTLTQTFSLYGITDFDVQYFDGTNWITVTGGSVSANNNVWRKFTFTAVSTSSIRVYVRGALAGYSRLTEIEAYGTATTTPVPPPTTTTNYALPANGGSATASSTYSTGYAATAVIDGDRRGNNWGAGGGWNDATANAYPDWVQVNFNGTKSISEIDVFTVQDNYSSPADPTLTQTFSLYGITDFDVQYFDGTNWITVTGGSVSANNNVWRKFTFTAVSTSSIRVYVRGALAGYSRLTEIEAYGTATTTPVPPPTTTTNYALPANGGSATASSTYSTGYAATAVIDGDRRGNNWGAGGGWNDATANAYPDWVQVNFNGTKSISEIDVFTVQDNYSSPADPTLTQTFSLYGITDFDVQYFDGTNWITVTGGSVSANNNVWRKFTFTAVSTSSIRVYVRGALAGYSRLTEIEAFGP